MQKATTIQKFNHVILTIVLLELFLGGTGRLIELTPVLTLRMCLFIVYMLVVLLYFIRNRTLPLEIVIITGSFILVNSLAIIVGYVNGASASDIFEDVKPLLNIFLLLYLSFSINTVKDITYILKLLKISSVVLVLLHLVLYGIFLKYNDITLLYSAVNSAESNNTVFLFKGESGFVNYTGDIYLCIGFIVWEQYHPRSLWRTIVLAFIVIAIILTGTRGLIISLALVYFVKWMFLKFEYRSLVYLLAGFVLVGGIYLNIKNNIGDKDESDQTRYEQIDEVKERITPLSAVIGHGYGVGVPIRPIHMEISYLEIFHKQGLVGLMYYFSILMAAYLSYKNSSRKNSMGFYMFILFIFFISATNPYVNHPLGITAISIALVCMIKLGRIEKSEGPDSSKFILINN